MTKRSCKQPGRAGFTLIELLVVVVIIGVLATLAIPRFSTFRDKAKETEIVANLTKIHQALSAFGVDNNALYPFRIRYYGAGTYENQAFDAADIVTFPPTLHSEAPSPWFSMGLIGGVETVTDTFSDNTQFNVQDVPKVIQPNGYTFGNFFRTFNQYSDPLVALGYLDTYPDNPFMKRPMGAIQYGMGAVNSGGALDKTVPHPDVYVTPGDFVYTFFYGTEGPDVVQPQGVSPARRSYQAKSNTSTDPGMYYLDLVDSYQLWAYGVLPLNGGRYVAYPNNSLGLSTRSRQTARKDWDNSGSKDMFEIGIAQYFKTTGSGATQSTDRGGKQLEF
jgi:prepilin-type N-terminal cleavage/methylation domain-containing protein